ncbi:acyl-CoA dehydrogenase family protein [Streptomyces hawaiiensis]|uniref:acyl-CoA dehydrogenase family protein n=1 Tax=Streptomyces hawaiiensis TaxID=67305 RepID=UPI00365048E9
MPCRSRSCARSLVRGQGEGLRHQTVGGLARDAVQAFGGLGFARELGADGSLGPVEAIYRDSKIGEICEGTNEIQKWVIARQIFGRTTVG